MSNSLKDGKKIETEQIVDECFMEFMDIVKKGQGFKGSTNTHSRNQLVYITPHKRLLHSEKQL